MYKFYLEQGNTQGAMASMKKVFNSRVIEKESQYKVLGDFLTFVEQNPKYQAELEGIVEVFSKDNNGQVFEKIAEYYLFKENKEIALTFYQKGIEVDPDNFSLLKNTLLLQLEFNRFAAAKKVSQASLEVFPAQPILYLLNAKANNNLQDFKAAINALETGLDYLFDNAALEKEFYEQLAMAYTGQGNTTKAANFAKKAAEILDSN
jgi:predicted Zn-dependent protease